MKALAFILSFISLLLWWEAPYGVMWVMVLNAVILLLKYDKSVICKLTVVFSIIALGLSVWNWDFSVGMYIVEHFFA